MPDCAALLPALPVTNPIGVCSWSLQPASPEELVERVRACGLDAVQLALDPLRTEAWDEGRTRRRLADAGIRVLSGMMGMAGEDYSTLETIKRTGGVRPDATWDANRAAAVENARLAARLGLDLVSFHAGFLPHEPGAERAKLVERLRVLCDVFAAEDVRVALETGQETAETLLAVLEEVDRENAGVNFDPANMVLYDQSDPIDALRRLAPRVLQLHVKDARRTRTPGTWGEEVPVGSGDVDWDAFLTIVRDHPLRGALVIEREAGAERVDDIRTAKYRVSHFPPASR